MRPVTRACGEALQLVHTVLAVITAQTIGRQIACDSGGCAATCVPRAFTPRAFTPRAFHVRSTCVPRAFHMRSHRVHSHHMCSTCVHTMGIHTTCVPRAFTLRAFTPRAFYVHSHHVRHQVRLCVSAWGVKQPYPVPVCHTLPFSDTNHTLLRIEISLFTLFGQLHSHSHRCTRRSLSSLAIPCLITFTFCHTLSHPITPPLSTAAQFSHGRAVEMNSVATQRGNGSDASRVLRAQRLFE